MLILFQSIGTLVHYNWALPFYILKERNNFKITTLSNVFSFLMGGYYYYFKSNNGLSIKFCNIGVNVIDNFMKNFYLFSKFIKTEKYDLMHINVHEDPLTNILLDTKLPKIFTFHGSLDITTPIPIDKCKLQKIFSKVDAFVVPSEHSAKTIQEVCKFKPIVIYHGIDVSIFNPSIPSNVARKKIGLHIDKKIILWNARLSPEKRLEDLIIALSLITRERNDVLVLVKTRSEVPSYKIRINRLIKRLGVERHILFDENWTPLIKMPIYYRTADLYVNTSVTEAFGSLAMLEAMACGIPTIANNSSSNPEALGDAGLLYNGEPYDLAEKILEILSNERLARILSYKSYKRIKENLTLTHIAKKYIDLYNRLMGYYSDE
jgi:glycosyltransferase involved in cell wall biosynthesis